MPTHRGPEIVPALALAVLILAIPASTLPFVTLSKLGNRHDPPLASAIAALTTDDLLHLGSFVALCAIVAPVTLAGLLAVGCWFSRQPRQAAAGRLHRMVVVVQYWAMPEVYLLGVLIAFVKLDEIVHVRASAGLWCYAGMAGILIWAWRAYVGQIPTEADAAIHRVHT